MSRAKLASAAVRKWLSMARRSASGSWLFEKKLSPEEESIAELRRIYAGRRWEGERFVHDLDRLVTKVRRSTIAMGCVISGGVAYAEVSFLVWRKEKKQAENDTSS